VYTKQESFLIKNRLAHVVLEILCALRNRPLARLSRLRQA
jgi:hypothetical protein